MSTENSTLRCRGEHSNHEEIKTFEQKLMNTKVDHDMRDRTEIAELFFGSLGGGRVVAKLGAVVGVCDVIKGVEVEVEVVVGKLKRISFLVTPLVDELAF